jgi:hypothetical protein
MEATVKQSTLTKLASGQPLGLILRLNTAIAPVDISL